MATWSSQRKTRYALGFFLLLLVLIGILSFLFLYKKPTCFDNKKNGDEFGVDCGGSCSRLCQSAFLPPKIVWGGAKFEKVSTSLYNVSSYIINPNVNGAAVDVPYKVTLYDANGGVVGEAKGRMDLYPHRNSLAFIGQVKVSGDAPAKATFEFVSAPEWFKSEDRLAQISITDKIYEENENGSKLQVILENKSLDTYKNIQVGVVLYDAAGNVIGFSQTFLDSISPRSEGNPESVPFTWPTSRNGKVIREEVVLSTKPIPLTN